MSTKKTLGVALSKCYFCQEDDKIILNKVLMTNEASKIEDLHGKVVDIDPCNKCAGYMERGIIIITIDNEKSTPNWSKPPANSRCTVFAKNRREAEEYPFWLPDPYRTGGWFVVKEEALKDAITSEDLYNWALKNRYIFMEEQAARMMGLFNPDNLVKSTDTQQKG